MSSSTKLESEIASSQYYDRPFYEVNRDGSLAAARIVVPLIMELLSVRSVCDFGCGVGTWLKAFQELGVVDVIGLDGAYVDASLLEIAAGCFVPTDLSAPVRLNRSFDLAVSLEVAEHLPASRARSFISDLTRAAPVVLFSAAIPGQRGDNHVNEQWQSYWAEHFAGFGYVPIDAIRARIWDNTAVHVWYRQNTLMYCAETMLTTYPKLACVAGYRSILSIVHPQHYELTRAREFGVQDTIRALPGLVNRALRRRLWRGPTN